MNNLFTELENQNKQIPLAEILRPKTLEDFLGQSNVVSPNSPILNLLKTNRLFSLIFWGTPGCGKTTLARLIATKTNANFIEISAVTSGVKDIKDAVESAKEALRCGHKTILFIDEIHRYSKTQQDALLPHLENGTLFLIGSTTENPSFQVVPALLSRVQVVRLNSIDDASMDKIIKKGFAYLAKNYLPMDCESGAIDFIINLARGDARYADRASHPKEPCIRDRTPARGVVRGDDSTKRHVRPVRAFEQDRGEQPQPHLRQIEYLWRVPDLRHERAGIGVHQVCGRFHPLRQAAEVPKTARGKG